MTTTATKHVSEFGASRSLRNTISEPPLRTMRQFAEQEIVSVPTGPFRGQPFRVDRQPYTRLWFRALEDPRFRRYVMTGPVQSGKSLCGFVIPLLYHLFERRETVILGVPDSYTAKDKWHENILPVIEGTQYRDLLPAHGSMSRGGWSNAIRFQHGETLRFMSGAGREEARSHYSSRVLIITETEKLDEVGAASKGPDKISELEGRTEAFGDDARVYMECTLTVDKGRTWREYQQGTASRIVCRCPRCLEWVEPERENLIGWRDAATVMAARAGAAFRCPACKKPWTVKQRERMNHRAKLIHTNEQTTNTLGFRWSAFHNLFVDPDVIAEKEWRSARDPDQDNAERRMLQQTWAMPTSSDRVEFADLDAVAITKRMTATARGQMPSGHARLTVGIDVGKYTAHWIAFSWGPSAAPHVIDYGVLEVPSADLGVEPAILRALQDFRDATMRPGWLTADGESTVSPNRVWIDSGYKPDPVYSFATDSGSGYLPSKGYGADQPAGRFYRRPRGRTSLVTGVGDHYHLSLLIERQNVTLVELDVDHWKGTVHDRLTQPMGSPGAMTLFRAANSVEHLGLARQLTAERQEQEFVAGTGMVRRWRRVNRANHWFDAAALACAAGHLAGARTFEGTDEPEAEVSLEDYYAQQGAIT